MDGPISVIRPRSRRADPATAAAPFRPAYPGGQADAAAILAGLERRVVGQARALREISLLLAMHSLASGGSRSPNAIVIGPTGVGKTHTLQAASRLLACPSWPPTPRPWCPPESSASRSRMCSRGSSAPPTNSSRAHV